MLRDSQYDMLKVCSLPHDLYDFGVVQRNCRKHVLHAVQIRHEPSRLINGTIWGPNLFPAELVKEAIDNAARLNTTLRTRWGLQDKRKSTEESGPQPKNKRARRAFYRGAQNQRAVLPVSFPASTGSSAGQPPKGQQHLFLVPGPQQSPAFIPAYEGQSLSFRMAGFHPYRGGRGRGGGGQRPILSAVARTRKSP